MKRFILAPDFEGHDPADHCIEATGEGARWQGNKRTKQGASVPQSFAGHSSAMCMIPRGPTSQGFHDLPVAPPGGHCSNTQVFGRHATFNLEFHPWGKFGERVLRGSLCITSLTTAQSLKLPRN